MYILSGKQLQDLFQYFLREKQEHRCMFDSFQIIFHVCPLQSAGASTAQGMKLQRVELLSLVEYTYSKVLPCYHKIWRILKFLAFYEMESE